MTKTAPGPAAKPAAAPLPVAEIPAAAASPTEAPAPVVEEPATWAPMTHPDGGSADAYPVDPETGHFMVPFADIEIMRSHGFVVVEANPSEES